jgi:hypothetical protein
VEGSALKKFDLVIEAVRYENGQISQARAYERRGATFSDRVLMSRADLVRRLEKGKKAFTGQRKELLASTFELGKPVQTVGQFVSTRPNADRDELEGVPLF